MRATVTVISCIYGGLGYERFIPGWVEAVTALQNVPDDVIVASDHSYKIPDTLVVVSDCDWTYPQAYYLQQAAMAADTDWIVIADIDDRLMPDALNGISEILDDVWQFGYIRSDGEVYVPPQLGCADFLEMKSNPYVGSSAIRLDAFRECGGFYDVALQDWALWRNMARRGMTFHASERPRFYYNRHPIARGPIELTAEARPAHIAEMMEREAVAH